MDGEKHMKRQHRLGERGVFSIFGVCALGILTLLTVTIYAVSMSHTASARRFLERGALRNTAEDGVRLAISRLNTEPAAVDEARNATAKHVKMFDGVSGDAKYTVYVRKKDGKILLLSVGQKGEERARAVGVAIEKNGKYLIEHWER